MSSSPRMSPDEPTKEKKISAQDAMAMNRHQRRALGKANGVKIPGTTKPYTKPVTRKQT